MTANKTYSPEMKLRLRHLRDEFVKEGTMFLWDSKNSTATYNRVIKELIKGYYEYKSRALKAERDIEKLK